MLEAKAPGEPTEAAGPSVDAPQTEKKEYPLEGDPFAFYKSLGSPQYFVAPMVD